MKIKLTYFVFLVLVSLCTSTASAQASKQKVSGFVRDSIGKALPFVTVNLFKGADLVVAVKSTYTNESGKFQLSNIDTGKYTLIVSHTGFADQQQELTVTSEDLVMPDIKLLQATADLKGVTVTARKPLIEQTDDKIIFNVENDPTTKTETAIDILRKTPFVTVDGDDNVQVNGQSNFKVLLNGRETAMFAQNIKEALKGFPGALITKIEVITSPSAKYDGEGVGGVINIITKKKVVGYNGSVNINYSRWQNINANFSAKFGKLGITVYYGAGGTTGQRGTNTATTIPKIPSLFTKRELSGSRFMKNLWNYGNAEFSYDLDSLNVLSAYTNISGGNGRSTTDQTITTDFTSSPQMISHYHLARKDEYPTVSVGTDYIKKFKSNKDREFSIRFNGEFGNSNSFLDSWQDNPFDDRFIINNSVASNKQYTIQSDYIHPLRNNQKLESGVKAILRRAGSDFESFIKYDTEPDYKVNPANTNKFNYDQDILSVYSSYSMKVKKTNFRLGARLEQTSVNGDFTSSATKVRQNYTTFLPNVQSTTKLNNMLTMVLTYSMRLQRPNIWNLNPFVNNNDSLNISFGNPDLGPQTINTFSVQTRIMKGPTFAGLTFETNFSGNKILQYATFDPATGVTKTTSMNIGKELQFALNGNFSTKITPDWNVYINGHVRYNKVTNNKIAGQSNSGISGNVNLNTNYKFNKRFSASGYAGFFRGPVTIQSSFPLNIWYGTGMGYKMFKEKLTISLGASNFFQKFRDYKMVTSDPNFTTTSVTSLPFRAVSISLNWNFGKMTENVSKKKGVTNDDSLGTGNQSGN